MQININKIKYRIILFSALYFTIASVALILHQHTSLHGILDEELAREHLIIQKTFDNSVSSLKERLISKTAVVLKNTKIAELIYNKKREELYAYLKATYQESLLEIPQMEIVTFRNVDGSVFLRMHQPEMFGDALNKKRVIISDTNAQQKAQFGFEIGKLKMTYRVVTPIFHNKQHVGLVEVGINPDFFISNLDKIFTLKKALLVRTDDLSISLDKNISKTVIDNFTLVEDANNFFKEALKKIDLKVEDTLCENTLYENNGEKYVIHNTLNLYDNRGGIAAKLLIADRITDIDLTYDDVLADDILAIIIIFLLTLSLLHFSINYYMQVIEKSRKELSDTKEFYEVIFNEAQVGITRAGADGKWISVNKHMSKILGYTKDELLNLSFLNITHPDDLAMDLEALPKLISGEINSYHREKRYFHKNGDIVWIDLLVTTIKDEEKGTYSLISVIQDITNRKAAEEEIINLNLNLNKEVQQQLKELREKDNLLLEQSKLAQMGEMLNMVAHQWRQPLNAISAAAIHLSLTSEFDELDKDFVEKISNSIQKMTQEMSQVINDFMMFNKSEANKEFFIYEAVSKTTQLIKAQLQSRAITLENLVDKELKIFHNMIGIEHVLLNIITNSRDAFEDKIDITDKKIKIYTTANDTSISLVVEDNAGGINEDIIDKIFNPYYTTKEQGKGTGLGLYMSKKIVENVLGTTIDVKVKDGHTIFTIVFFK